MIMRRTESNALETSFATMICADLESKLLLLELVFGVPVHVVYETVRTAHPISNPETWKQNWS